MDFFIVTLGIVAGICAGFGLLFLFVGLRRRESKKLNLTFSLFALAYAGAIIAAANQYSSTTIAEFVAAGRLNGPFVVLAWTSLIWYVSIYTDVKPRPLLLLLTISFVIAGIFNTSGSFLLYEEIQSLEILSLPWGEQLALAIGPEGPVLLLFLLTQLVAAAYILVACVIQYRRGERQAALALAIGMIWFIITIVVDSLVDTGAITFIYLSDFGFLVLAITLSLQMSNEIIETEEELDQHRHNLESLVEARTAKLEEAQKQLLLQTQEQATLEERNRLARDLHDAVTQTIYSAALIAEALPQIWERRPKEGQRNLVKLRQLVRGALAEMRALLFELRPAALETVDLELLLHQQCDALTGRTRIPVDLAIEGQSKLPSEVKITFYRITQEAFNNIAKHAQADRVKVSLQQTADEVILTIEDNGRGFEESTIPAERMGLQFMRERAGNIDASLEVRSQPAQGTRLAVAWSRKGEVTK